MRRGGAGVLLAAALLGVSPALAQEAILADLPAWTNRDDVARYYPDRAWRMGVSSWARVRCTPNDKGLLLDCIVVGEGVADQGFGQGVLKVARLTRVPPARRAEFAGKPSYLLYVFRRDEGELDPGPVRGPDRAVIEGARPANSEPIGMATVRCPVPLTKPDPLRDCVAAAESPTGQGYGAVAVGLAEHDFHLVSDVPAEVKIRFTLPHPMDVNRRWTAEVDTPGFGLDLVRMTPGGSIAELPEIYVRLICRWRPDGRLRKCRAVPATPAMPRKTVKAAVSLLSNLRLVRHVTFNVNWGQ
jgi:hypothetical protein